MGTEEPIDPWTPNAEELQRLEPYAQLWRDFDLDWASMVKAIQLVRDWHDTDENLARQLVGGQYVREDREHEFIERVRALP